MDQAGKYCKECDKHWSNIWVKRDDLQRMLEENKRMEEVFRARFAHKPETFDPDFHKQASISPLT